ncbi:MAG: S8 family peptidase [Pseudobdellovibrionaceae bacterium]
MDVQKILSAVICIIVLSSCGKKSTSTVFPENSALDSAACTGQAIKNKFIVQWEDGSFTVESAADAEEFTNKFLEPQLTDIRHVDFDRQIQVRSPEGIKPESTASSSTTQAVDSWGQDLIQARNVWNQGVLGQGVKVGIVDAYVDVQHPQLAGRIAINTGEIPNNKIDDDGNGVVDDYYGGTFVSGPNDTTNPSPHGTHVAGIIAADPQNGTIEGMAPQAQIIPAQFISSDGSGSLGDAVLALQYAASRGAKIINASWGGAPCVASLRNTFTELQNKGILVIVAAGNDGRDIDVYPEFPAAFDIATQITVAASSVTDFMTSWSNSGFQNVHVAAPGEHILSTTPNNTTAYMDGTSMAAPFVSGAAALLWSAQPKATAQQIKDAILKSVDVNPGHEFKVKTKGRINVQKALETLRQLVP